MAVRHLLLVGLSTLLIAGCNETNTVDLDSNIKHKLRSPSSLEFSYFLHEELIKRYATKVEVPIYYMEDSAGPPTATPSSVTSSNVISGTNLQEQGVDEADIIKTKYPFIYQIDKDNRQLKRYRYRNDTKKMILNDSLVLAIEKNQQLKSLYYYETAERHDAIVLSNNNNRIYDNWFMPSINWNNNETQLHWVDTRDSNTLQKKHSIQLEGGLISSRRVGSTLYLALRHAPLPTGLIVPYDKDQLAKNKQIIEQSTINDLMPVINNAGNKTIVSPTNCYVPTYQKQNGHNLQIVYMVAVNLNNPTMTPKAKCLAGGIEAVYASPDAMYLSTTEHAYEMNGGAAIYLSPSITTDIHKFSLTNGDLEYRGSGSVKGHLGWSQDKKSFRMGEHNNQLRVLSYVGDNNMSTNPSPARLTILEEDNVGDLKVVSQLPNEARPKALGKPGEKIYSTRFMGDKAYLVTFRTIDPLYILDLSNPNDPKIAGELEIKGYSDYLHPINNNWLLGIGKDAIAADGNGDRDGAWYQGVKIALFDVSDPANPIETDRTIIGKRGTSTAVASNHHAFTSVMFGNTFRFALPLSLHNGSENNSPSQHYPWINNQLNVYDIDLANPSLNFNNELSKVTVSERYEANSDDRALLIDSEAFYLLGGKTWH